MPPFYFMFRELNSEGDIADHHIRHRKCFRVLHYDLQDHKFGQAAFSTGIVRNRDRLNMLLPIFLQAANGPEPERICTC